MDWLDCGFEEEAEDIPASLIKNIVEVAEAVGIKLSKPPVIARQAPPLMSHWSSECPPDTAVGWGIAQFGDEPIEVAVWSAHNAGSPLFTLALGYVSMPPDFVSIQSFFQYYDPVVKMAAKMQAEAYGFENEISKRYSKEVTETLVYEMKYRYFGQNRPANPRVARCGNKVEVDEFENELSKSHAAHTEVVEIDRELYLVGFDLFASKAV